MDLFIQTKRMIRGVDGYKLENGMACHRSIVPEDKSWVIVDIDSGLMIKENMKSVKSCREYSIDNPDKEKLDKIKETTRYKKYVEKINYLKNLE